MKKLFCLLILLFFTSVNAQYDLFDDEDTTGIECNYGSFDLGTRNTGISFGNSPEWSGLRINFSDCGIRKINGINITFWKPGKSYGSFINGIALGLSPYAGSLNGLSLGLLASVSESKMSGIHLGGLAVVSAGKINGLAIGGLAIVAKEGMRGINFGGLAVVSDADIAGANFGGLALVAKGDIKGINFGGLALVSDGYIKGVNFGGIALVSKESIMGINMGGIALVADGEILGLSQALVAVVSKGAISGINIAGYKTEAEEIRGFSSTVGWVDVEKLIGFSVATYHKINGMQRGIVIGLLNVAEELHGIQIGLINIAKNNRGFAKVLPFINAHFN